MPKAENTGQDERFMSIAINLAKKGLFSVEPNPAVGAVLVKDNKIIGKGYHKQYATNHAEINAINDAIKKGYRPVNATLYVTLEPCCHYGKTPPCTDAIISAKIKSVVIASIDPSEKVKGAGIKILKNAGIKVKTGILEEQAEQINQWFYKFHRTGKPWLICKWAQTIDGKLAAHSGHSKWISSSQSRTEAHKLRRSVQAIVVGIDTANIDNPMLTVRNVQKTAQPTPARVVFDSKLRIKSSANLIKTADETPTYICTTKSAIERKPAKYKLLQNKNVNLISLPTDKTGRIKLSAFLKFAAKQDWPRIMIEGGAKLISSAISDKLADEIVIFLAPKFALDKAARQFHRQQSNNVADFLSDYRFIDYKSSADDLILRLWRK